MMHLVEESAAAVALRNKVFEQVYEFITNEPGHAYLGIYSVMKIGVDLLSHSTMNDETKLVVARSLFFDLVHNTDLEKEMANPANQN